MRMAVVPTGSGTPLHGVYLQATTMTFAGIVSCQVGTALAARTERASLRQVGFFTNPLRLWGIASEIGFLALLVTVPPLQAIFGTRGLGLSEIALLCSFPVVVWGADELRRARLRRVRVRPDGLGTQPGDAPPRLERGTRLGRSPARDV